MTEVLLVVGVIVFFITVCGAIMVGGHLLEELARVQSIPDPTPVVARSASAVATTSVST